MNNENLNPKSVDDILTETELIELLGVKKGKLSELRLKHKLPFCKISNTNRIYFVQDVLNFLIQKRIILNRADSESYTDD